MKIALTPTSQPILRRAALALAANIFVIYILCVRACAAVSRSAFDAVAALGVRFIYTPCAYVCVACV